MTKQWYAAERMLDFRAGLVVATIANVNRGRNAEPFDPSDFFPRLRQKRDMEAELDRLFGLG